MDYFKKLGLCKELIDAIADRGFERPTEIQEKSIPLILEGKDVVGSAATGSGKTLAFSAGIIQHSNPGHGIQSLILAPTRELAEQVKDSFQKFSIYKKLKITAIYGGISINPQIKALETADVVVGTPGRILDHLSRKTIDLNYVNFLVLDEADRLLDMGFLPDVEDIISYCPKKRQTLLFSATISQDIQHLIQKHMSQPVKISAKDQVDPLKLSQVYFQVEDNMKFSLLINLLKNEKSDLVMVFCNSRKNVDFIAKNLRAEGFDTQAIHGGFSQNKRNKALDKFHSQNAHVLVCTDVAARGLDIPFVSHVYNYDIPKEAKQYVHRIGRTARAGKEGQAISILSPRDHDNFRQVLRTSGAKIEKKEIPEGVERIQIKWHEPSRQGFRGRGNRGRPSFQRSSGYSRSGNSNYSSRDSGYSRPRSTSHSSRDSGYSGTRSPNHSKTRSSNHQSRDSGYSRPRSTSHPSRDSGYSGTRTSSSKPQGYSQPRSKFSKNRKRKPNSSRSDFGYN